MAALASACPVLPSFLFPVGNSPAELGTTTSRTWPVPVHNPSSGGSITTYSLVISPFSFVPPLRAVRQQEGHPAHRDLAVQKRPLQDDHRRQEFGGRRRPRLHPQRGQGGKNKGYQFGTNLIEYSFTHNDNLATLPDRLNRCAGARLSPRRSVAPRSTRRRRVA